LASGGALSRGTSRRNLEVRLPSEPLRNPARTPSPGHVSGKCSATPKLKEVLIWNLIKYNKMRKIGFIIGFVVLTSSVFGQQFLWSTVKDTTSNYVPLNDVINEVLKFYDHYDFYYDASGFSKDRFFEFVENFENNSDDWKKLKKKIYDIKDLTVFALRDNLGRGSVVFVMCISKDNINMLLFSNNYEPDAILTTDRNKFVNWFKTLLN